MSKVSATTPENTGTDSSFLSGLLDQSGLKDTFNIAGHIADKLITPASPALFVLKQTFSYATQEGAPELNNTTLSPSNSFDPQVLAMQSKLQALGYDLEQGHNFANDGVDGYYGKVTTAAVEKFQADNNLDVTGIANAETLGLMQEKFAVLPEAQKVATTSLGQSNQNQTFTDTQDIANRLINDLQDELGITNTAAIGIVANLAHECNGFQTLQEINPLIEGSRGGCGYAQWTGSRRRDFESWSAERGLDTSSYEANKGFLIHELKNTPESRVLDKLDNVSSAQEATQVFSDKFLRPGIPHMDSRLAWANRIEGNQTASTIQVASIPGAPTPI